MGDFLFGSPGGVQTGSSLTPGQQQLADLLTGIFSQNLGQTGTPYPGTLGPTGPNATQQTAMNSLTKLLEGGLDQGFMTEIRGALSDVFSDTGDVSNKTIESLIRKPAIKNLQEVVLPEVEESFAGPGTFWSSARAEAEQNATQNTADQMATGEANLRYNTKQAAMDRKVQAIPGATNLLLAPAELTSALSQSLFSMGTQINAQSAQTMLLQYQDWLRTQPENSPYLNAALSMLGIPFMYAFLQQPTQGALGQLLQGIGAIMGTAPASA